VCVCVCVCLKSERYAKDKRQSFLINNLSFSSKSIQHLRESNVLIDLYSWDWISCRLTLSHPYVNSFEVPHVGWFLHTYDCSNRERKNEKEVYSYSYNGTRKKPDSPHRNSLDGHTRPVTSSAMHKIRQKAKNTYATVHASGVGRMGVTQLLSAVKPANRGSQTPL